MAEQPSKEKLTITEDELEKMATLPGALRALADWHSNQESCADAMDMVGPAKYHGGRAKMINAEADRIQKEWENG